VTTGIYLERAQSGSDTVIRLADLRSFRGVFAPESIHPEERRGVDVHDRITIDGSTFGA
jgi:hypothetical protein